MKLSGCHVLLSREISSYMPQTNQDFAILIMAIKLAKEKNISDAKNIHRAALTFVCCSKIIATQSMQTLVLYLEI